MMIGSSEFNIETQNQSDRFIVLGYEITCKNIAQSLRMVLEHEEIWQKISTF